MTTILGIDAAWTATEPSGVALVRNSGSTWECLAVAPSYQSFLESAAGTPIDWSARPIAGLPDPPALLKAARRVAGVDVDVVTIDMPVSTVPFAGRRTADDEVSRKFGNRGCSTHTSNPERPGPLGAQLSAAFRDLGYSIATRATPVGTPKCLVEIYPHPALLALLGRPRRVPYKVSKSGKYWPGAVVHDRIKNLLSEYEAMAGALREEFGDLPVVLPPAKSVPTLSHLKRHEDTLDALIACWVGKLYYTGDATALGDAHAAIWVPSASLNLPPLG